MRVRVDHNLGNLARDCLKAGATVAARGPKIVKRHTELGHKAAQRIARQQSGPHGRLYYKRITSEMLSPLEGEYGPTGDVVGNAVGAGWRSGPPNMDLPKSADIVAPKYHKAIDGMIDDAFWPGS